MLILTSERIIHLGMCFNPLHMEVLAIIVAFFMRIVIRKLSKKRQTSEFELRDFPCFNLYCWKAAFSPYAENISNSGPFTLSHWSPVLPNQAQGELKEKMNE